MDSNANTNVDPNVVEKGNPAGDVRPGKPVGTPTPQTKKGRRDSASRSRANGSSLTKNTEPVTKAAKVVTLLRGFLSGTVKKKLGP